MLVCGFGMHIDIKIKILRLIKKIGKYITTHKV